MTTRPTAPGAGQDGLDGRGAHRHARTDVSVVIVSYNTRDVLDACLRALLASRGLRLEVIVVDNGSPDGSADYVARAFPEVTLIRNPDNRGFAAANNVALRHTRGRAVLLLNPDTIVDSETVARLTHVLDTQTDVGIVGPRVLNRDGTLQSCGYWYPTLTGEILQSRLGGLLAFLAPHRASRHVALAEPMPGLRDVEWVDGCCLLIRGSLIDRIGPLDEQFFLYAEELDWCRRARAAGWRITTSTEASMVHLGGQSSEQVKTSALALLIETRLRYYTKHDGLLTALLVSGVYVLGSVAAWRREPEKSRAKLRGISQWWRARRGRSAVRPAVAMPRATMGGRDIA